MQPIEECVTSCPYCGESISTLVTHEDIGSTRIEDCFVCCRPIEITIALDVDTDGFLVAVRAENDSYDY